MIIGKILQTFDWTNEEGTVSISLDITRMLEAIDKGELQVEKLTALLDRSFAEMWISRRDINLSYVFNMSPLYRDKPVLGAWLPDETVLLIDGSHRYTRRYKDNLETVDYNLVSLNDWPKYATIKGELKL